MQLCSVALMSLHWYACATWLQSCLLAEGGRQSWVATVMDGTFGETTEAWPWQLWARYASSFARALNAVVGGEKVGGTHAEVVRSCTSNHRTTCTRTLHSVSDVAGAAYSHSVGAPPVPQSSAAWRGSLTSPPTWSLSSTR